MAKRVLTLAVLGDGTVCDSSPKGPFPAGDCPGAAAPHVWPSPRVRAVWRAWVDADGALT